MNNILRYRINFTGRVQGVGFRYKANHIANTYRLTGFVKNEYDGSVTVELQGRQAEIDMFLQLLKQDRYIDIYDMDMELIPVEDDERGFGITY